jgi:hypothetical protein
VLAVAAMLMLTTRAMAQPASAIESSVLAADLARHALAGGHPLAVAAAVELLLDLGAAPRCDEDDPYHAPAIPQADGTSCRITDEARRRQRTLRSLLDSAARLAQGDRDVSAVIATLGRRVGDDARGGLRGPQLGYYRIDRLATQTFRIGFDASTSAEVLVRPDGAAMLSCTLTDDRGHALKTTTRRTRGCRMTFMPPANGRVRLLVRNAARQGDAYLLVTN